MNFANLKKRDKFWIEKLMLFAAGFLIFAVLSFINLLVFNNSYMLEEQEELDIFARQVEWAVTPMLESKNYDRVQKYSVNFINKDYRFRIFDKNKKLIASSKPNADEPMLEADNNIFKKRTSRLKIYRHSIKDRKIGLLREVIIKNKLYYFEIIISEDDVLKNIVKAQRTIFILSALFVIFLVWSFYYVINQITLPFDKLENSIIKIANGELDAHIDIHKNEILFELNIAIKKMANQLKSQIIRLKQLEEYKNDFIQSVTHEIKTPITAINMAIELIETNEAKNLKPQTKECFDIINFQINYINSLVNDISTLAELEEGAVKEQNNFSLFNLNDAVKKVINYNKHSTIKVNFIENASVDFFGDPELIKRLVLNILTNAYKYSKTDKVDITLSKLENNCILKIKDYGIGIDKTLCDKVFDKFYRVDKSRSRQKGGTGLGLAIVKSIIELHKGSIELKSDINQGSDFIINLPLKFIS